MRSSYGVGVGVSGVTSGVSGGFCVSVGSGVFLKVGVGSGGVGVAGPFCTETRGSSPTRILLP